MPKVIVTHEVDDVTHWLESKMREEVFSDVVEDIRTFVHPTDPNKVGLSMDISDMSAFDAVMESEAGAEAMKFDGVRPETIVLYVEG